MGRVGKNVELPGGDVVVMLWLMVGDAADYTEHGAG